MTVSAIVLCGGLSSRMGQLTSNTPKSLLKVNKRPIIWYTIGFLYKNGIKKFIFPLLNFTDLVFSRKKSTKN